MMAACFISITSKHSTIKKRGARPPTSERAAIRVKAEIESEKPGPPQTGLLRTSKEV